MAALRSRYRRGGRWWMVGTTFALATVFMVFFVAASGALTGSKFEGADGNLVVDTSGSTDWANAPAFVRATPDDPTKSNTDNAFGQGAKEDLPNPSEVQGSIPPNKSDLTRFYVSHETTAAGTFLYLAWERSNVLGSANMDFELNQSPTLASGRTTPLRTAGDLLVTYDFTNGGSRPLLGLLTWVTSGSVSQCFSSNALPCWGNRVDLTAAGNAEGAINTTTVTDPIAGGSLAASTFGEASINLTAALPIFANPTTCETFGSAFLKSRSSASFTAELKDFVAPQPIRVSNCGSITISKVTENGDGSFGFTTTGGLATSSAAGALSTFSLSNGQSQGLVSSGQAGVLAGSYSVSESTLPSGWALKSLSCTATGAGTSDTTSGSQVSITMAPGGDVQCTYTNHTNATPGITTTLSDTPINAGGTIHDSATLSGATANAGGTVTYTVYSDDHCTTSVASGGTKTVTNGSVPNSSNVTFNSAGDYYWQAVYSGDANNAGATSTCTDEHLVVKANPTITTLLSATTVDVGDKMHDSATLSGQTAHAGGTVDYKVYSDNSCSTQVGSTITVTVTDGSVPNSTDVSFNTGGDYYFRAFYSGDTYNNSASSVCTDEHLIVKAKPSISTTLSAGSVSIGTSVHDSASLSNATTSPAATGTVTFTVYSDNQCKNVYGSGGTKALGVDSDSVTFNTAGDYYWQAVYSGDTYNNGATSACTDEHLVVGKNSPTVSTAQNLKPNDSMTISGATAGAGGTVTFNLYSPSDASCSGTPALTQTVNVSGNGTYVSTNTTFIASDVGTWRWKVVYSGDANNETKTSACGVENFTITNG